MRACDCDVARFVCEGRLVYALVRCMKETKVTGPRGPVQSSLKIFGIILNYANNHREKVSL